MKKSISGQIWVVWIEWILNLDVCCFFKRHSDNLFQLGSNCMNIVFKGSFIKLVVFLLLRRKIMGSLWQSQKRVTNAMNTKQNESVTFWSITFSPLSVLLRHSLLFTLKIHFYPFCCTIYQIFFWCVRKVSMNYSFSSTILFSVSVNRTIVILFHVHFWIQNGFL